MAERILYQFCGAGDMPGGVQDATNTVAGYMAEQGLEPHVFIGSTDDRGKTEEVFDSFDPENIHVLGGANNYTTANGSQNPLGGIVWPAAIKHEIQSVQPDLVHINAPWMPHIGGQVLRRAQKEALPTVGTYHIVSEERATNLALAVSRFVDKKAIDRLDAMIAVSEPAQEHMERTYKYQGDVRIIPNGVDIDRYEQAKPFEANEPFDGFDPDSNKTVVFVGRPDPRKGLGELISAFHLVRRKIPDIQLVVCGGNDASLQQYREQADNLRLRNVSFLGRVSEEDKARWLSTADVAAFPALGGESQGIVLLEAMAAGAGVVMGGNNKGYAGVLGELPDSDITLVDPKMSSKFAEKMELILQYPLIASDIHVDQQKLVRRKYDSRVTGQQVLDVYRELL